MNSRSVKSCLTRRGRCSTLQRWVDEDMRRCNFLSFSWEWLIRCNWCMPIYYSFSRLALKTIFVSTKRALIANKKVTWALALKLKGGATIAKGKDDDSKCCKWRMDSKKLRDAIRAIRAIRRMTIKRKANKRGKRARSSMYVPWLVTPRAAHMKMKSEIWLTWIVTILVLIACDHYQVAPTVRQQRLNLNTKNNAYSFITSSLHSSHRITP